MGWMAFLASLRGQLILATVVAAVILAAAGTIAIFLHGHEAGEAMAAISRAAIPTEIAEQLRASVVHDHATMRGALIGGTFGTVALLCVLGWFFLIRRIGRRLDTIREALGAMPSHGVRIAVEGRDEIAEMARAAERRIAESAALEAAQRAVTSEREKLQTIIEHGTSAIVVVNANLTVESANPVAAQLFCRPASALIGSPVTSMLAQDDRSDARGKALWQRLVEAGRLTEIDFDRIDGSRVPVEIAVVTFRDESGAVRFYNLIARDLSQRRTMERQLREAEAALREQAEETAAKAQARLLELMASTAQGVLICDADDQVMLVNDAFLDTYLPETGGGDLRGRVAQGMGFDTLAELIVRSGALGPPGADLEARIATWRAVRTRGDGAGLNQDLADGRHVVATHSRMVDGGLITIVTDVSETVRRANELALITNNIPALIAYVDVSQRIQFINRTGERWYARPASEIVGRRLEEVLPPDLREFVRPLVEGVLAGQVQRVERRVGYPDGTERWIQIRYVPDVRPDGAVAGFFALSIDNTEAIQNARDLAAIAHNLPVLISRVDAEERYRFINRTGESWYGRPADQLVGRKLSELMTPEHYAKVKPHLDAVLRGEPQQFEYFVTRPNAAVRWVESRFVPDAGPDGAIRGYYSLVIDTTERRGAEEQLQHLQRLKAVGQLTGGIAHDFNNILGVVLGNLDLLSMRAKSDPQQALLVQRATDAAARGASLTHHLLAFGRRQMLVTRLTSVNTLIAEMGDLLARTLSKDVMVGTMLGEHLWLVMIDPVQLESAILNLAINARDARARQLTIETANVSLDKAALADAEAHPGDYVMVAVHDDGDGMSPEVLSRALEPFFTTKEVGKGTGLGLSMVYGFVKQSGGHVALKSEPGVGTTVTLFVPRGVSSTATAPAAKVAQLSETA